MDVRRHRDIPTHRRGAPWRCCAPPDAPDRRERRRSRRGVPGAQAFDRHRQPPAEHPLGALSADCAARREKTLRRMTRGVRHAMTGVAIAPVVDLWHPLGVGPSAPMSGPGDRSAGACLRNWRDPASRLNPLRCTVTQIPCISCGSTNWLAHSGNRLVTSSIGCAQMESGSHPT